MNDTTKQKLNQQIHAGRRNKLRARFVADGLATFNECEVLEFALGFAIPRLDTNPAAHSLINTFGSLAAVLETTPADLQNAYGIGENAAVFLSFLKQLTTYMANSKVKHARIHTPAEATNYLRPLMRTFTVEQFLVVSLDIAGKVKSVNTITNQEFNVVHLNLRQIVSLVTAHQAAQVIIAHNHLNDSAMPSMADMNLTRRLLTAFAALDIKFLDHIIFSNKDDYSFVCSGLMDVFRNETTH